jgi:hypothetical protein
MKTYRIEDYVAIEKCHSYGAQNDLLIDECEFLGNAFYRMYREIDRLDCDNAVLAQQAIAARIAEIRRREATAEARQKKRELERAQQREKEQARAAARQAALAKLTYEEKVAYGLIRPEKKNGKK